MAINLKKGGRINLTKEKPGLSSLLVGLGWDTNQFDTGFDFDLDASAFVCGSNGKCSPHEHGCTYGGYGSESRKMKNPVQSHRICCPE